MFLFVQLYQILEALNKMIFLLVLEQIQAGSLVSHFHNQLNELRKFSQNKPGCSGKDPVSKYLANSTLSVLFFKLNRAPHSLE